LAELVDKIASPTVRASMLEWTYKKLDSFPTPTDYAKALALGERASPSSQVLMEYVFARLSPSSMK